MKIINKRPGEGRMLELIRLSSKTNSPIITSKDKVLDLVKLAEQEKINIPYPLAYEAIKTVSSGISMIIDNPGKMIEFITGNTVSAISSQLPAEYCN